MMGGMQAVSWSNDPNNKRRQKFIEKLANYLYEQAKATGLKVAEVAKEWYAENSKTVRTEEKQNLKKIVTEAATNANNRVKQEPPQARSDDTTGPKQAKTDELREKLGLGERIRPEKQTQKQLDADAASIMQDDPTFASRLAAELVTNPRALEDPVVEHVLGR